MLKRLSSIFGALCTPAKPNRDVPRNALLCSLFRNNAYFQYLVLVIFPYNVIWLSEFEFDIEFKDQRGEAEADECPLVYAAWCARCVFQ